jgi:hypothetical protein
MGNTNQYECLAVKRSGEVERYYSTDYDKACAQYGAVKVGDILYKVLWCHVEHSPLDPRVIKQYGGFAR